MAVHRLATPQFTQPENENVCEIKRSVNPYADPHLPDKAESEHIPQILRTPIVKGHSDAQTHAIRRIERGKRDQPVPKYRER